MGRKLNFTRSNYKDINGLFAEALPNQRYHLYIYTRNTEIHQQLRDAAKQTSDQNYLSLEMNKMNNLFILPPFCDQIYRVQALNQHHELYEKVIEFPTGPNNTMIDLLNMIDTKKYRMNYIVCNREKSFISFRDGIDAIEAVNILRHQNIVASFANCYAHIDVEGNNQFHPVVVRNQGNAIRLNNNRGARRMRGMQQQQNHGAFRPNIYANDARHNIRPINFANQRGRGVNRGRPYRRRNYPRRPQQAAPHAVRVPLPVDANHEQFEWVLVRR